MLLLSRCRNIADCIDSPRVPCSPRSFVCLSFIEFRKRADKGTVLLKSVRYFFIRCLPINEIHTVVSLTIAN